MQLKLDTMGRIAADYPATFYRVENWTTGRRVADFATKSEAEAFAISDARATGCRYDHSVATMRVQGRHL
jgi:hypothetical protein